MHTTIDQVQLVEMPSFDDKARGMLLVVEGNITVPFEICRTFFVIAPANVVRGKHAHKVCSQFLICLNGAIEVHCDDAYNERHYLLDNPRLGLLVPSHIWSQQTYIRDSVVCVECSKKYDPDDYVTDYEQFRMLQRDRGGSWS